MKRLLLIGLLASAAGAPAEEPKLPAEKPAGKLELVAAFLSHTKLLNSFSNAGGKVDFATKQLSSATFVPFAPKLLHFNLKQHTKNPFPQKEFKHCYAR